MMWAQGKSKHKSFKMLFLLRFESDQDETWQAESIGGGHKSCTRVRGQWEVAEIWS